jgi:molecular chaperone GrpE
MKEKLKTLNLKKSNNMQATDKKTHQAPNGPDVCEDGIENVVKTPEEDLQEQLDQKADRLLRLQAEFDNYRKRTAKERLELVLTASEDVISGILPVLDDCQRALKTLQQLEDADPNYVEGIQLIYNKLYGYLQSKGLKIIEAEGKELDTDFHCAVAKTEVQEKKKKGKIVDVVLEGYTLNGKVIRFANVVVGE